MEKKQRTDHWEYLVSTLCGMSTPEPEVEQPAAEQPAAEPISSEQPSTASETVQTPPTEPASSPEEPSPAVCPDLDPLEAWKTPVSPARAALEALFAPVEQGPPTTMSVEVEEETVSASTLDESMEQDDAAHRDEWARLAAQLGLLAATPDRPGRRRAAPQSPAIPKPPIPKPPVGKRAVAETTAPPTVIASEPGEPGETFQVDTFGGAPEDEIGEKKSRRRRRRRRPKKGGEELAGAEDLMLDSVESPDMDDEEEPPRRMAPPPPRETRSRSAPVSPIGFGAGIFPEDDVEFDDELDEVEADEDIEFEETIEPTTARKKSRRRSRRKTPREPLKGESAPEEVESIGPRKRLSQPVVRRPIDPEEDEAEDELVSQEIHRAIPSWQDAISVIVAANMQTRQRSGNAPRSRGGRRRN